MSSAAYLNWCPDEGPDRATWDAFCGEHGIVHRPEVAGGNVFYAGEVEITVHGLNAPSIDRITVSTYWMGDAVPDVAALAWTLWIVQDGALLEADREIRAVLDERVASVGPQLRGAMSEPPKNMRFAFVACVVAIGILFFATIIAALVAIARAPTVILVATATIMVVASSVVGVRAIRVGSAQADRGDHG